MSLMFKPMLILALAVMPLCAQTPTLTPATATTTAPPAQTVAAAPIVPAAVAPTSVVPAAEVKVIDSGDTAWVMIATALVFLMTAPGLALFYGGLVRRKNILSVLMQCMGLMFVLSLLWVIFGYSLSFGPDIHGLIGSSAWFGLNGVSNTHPFKDVATGLTYGATIPHSLFMLYQMMFAVITPALIIGAYAERVRFAPFLAFSVLWSFAVYYPVCHWIWGIGGFLGSMNASGKGAVDFAGGIVVHVTAGVSALGAAIFLGKRKGFPDKMSPPHNLPLAVIGAGLLWFGWFGFNAGSALGANSLAVTAMIATHVAGATAGLTWAGLDWIINRKPTMLGAITGAIGGLATITPASGYVDVWGAIAIGFLAGLIPFLFVMVIKPRLNLDDTLDAWGVHGVGGIIGSICVGVFANPIINGRAGLIYGDASLFVSQLKAVGIVAVYSLVATYLLMKLVDVTMHVRASDHEERVGLDLTQHKESAYTVID